MDISSPMDCNSQTETNFDMEILTSMTNTDLLVRLIKDQEAETVVLKNQLSSLNSSALQMKNCYTSERTKNDHIEKENRQLLLRIKALEENISQLDNNLLNDAALHKQRTAGLENSLASAYRHLMIQRNVLKANHLSIKDSHQQYNNAKEFLKKRGEVVVEDIKDVKVISKKQKAVNASTMTDQCDSLKPKKVKQFCDKATMHCPMVSTATRGTTTSTFIKQADAATNFPEPMTMDVDEIFRIMIDDMPPAITPIEDLPSKTQCTQTEPPPQLNVGTITRIKNVRRKINCATEYTQSSSASSPVCRVKKEKEDSIPDLLNLDYSGNGSPINQQLTQLWQMVGQMIFGIIGSGEVFNHSNNISLINENLNQIRRVIAMESQPETQFHSMDDFVDQQPSGEDFNISTAVSGCGIGNGARHNNATEASDPVSSSQNPPHNQLSAKQIQTDTTQTEATAPLITIRENSTHSRANPVNSSAQRETESIFKKPTSKTKRKLVTEDCTIRKRVCQRKMTPKPRSSQIDETKPRSIQHKTSSCSLEATSTPADSVEQSTSPIDEPNASLVENILRYLKMPDFIEPITDPPHILKAINRLSKAEKNTESIQVPETTDLPASVPKTVDSETNDPMSVNLPTHSQSDDLTSSDVSMELSTYDEFESPASPPPSVTTSYQAPIIIPTSPKKLNSLVVGGILANFDKNKRTSLRQRKLTVPTVEEEQILTSTRNRIEQYVVAEWTGNEIDACCTDLSTIRPSVLSKCILEVVSNTKGEHLSKEFTPPAPSLPRTHQKIIVLIKRISRTVNGFEELVLFQLEKTMFVLGDEQVTIAEGLNLTHLFIGLTDCTVESNGSCVLFVYKCLYYFSVKAIPMIYSVLMAYPTILPKFDDGEKVTDFLRNTTNILQATFVILLINTNLSESPVDSGNSLKKRDLSTYLKTYYHYPCMSPTTDDFVDILLDRLTNSCNLGNISYSLILIAKRNGTVWADNMVQRKLLPKLNQFLSTISDGTANDERIAVLVSAISSIIKTYPITKDISSYQQLFYKILDSTTRQRIQEEAVMALLRTSRFGMVDVYKQICDWRPQTAVRRQCYSMLSTFLYRQNLSYWQNF